MGCGAPAVSTALGRRDFQARAPIGEEAAGAAFHEAGADLRGEALGGLEIGIPFPAAVGGDETIAEHMPEECQGGPQVPSRMLLSAAILRRAEPRSAGARLRNASARPGHEKRRPEGPPSFDSTNRKPDQRE